jgi:uncharacterized protein YbaR (Trm112 family)
VIDHNLLDILVCPETKQPLRVADESVLEAVNASIVAGSMSNRGGEVVTVAVTEGLIREDGDVLYPVRDDIPIMLIDESIPLPTQA